jgi:glutathione synthase
MQNKNNRNNNHNRNNISSHLHMKIPLDKLTTFANSYAAANGIQVEKREKATSSNASSSYVGAPISLLPNAFPAKAFHNAQSLAPHFNILVDRISRDGEFLVKTLGGEHGVISKDLYTKKLLELYVKLYMTTNQKDDKPNFAKDADYLGIMRSDYMLSPVEGGDRYDIFQVELNTIASSFAGLACKIANLHQILTERFDVELKVCFLPSSKCVHIYIHLNENINNQHSSFHLHSSSLRTGWK